MLFCLICLGGRCEFVGKDKILGEEDDVAREKTWRTVYSGSVFDGSLGRW